jgi:hypothetical protein
MKADAAVVARRENRLLRAEIAKLAATMREYPMGSAGMPGAWMLVTAALESLAGEKT